MVNSRSPQVSLHDGVTVIQLGTEYENLNESSMEGLGESLMHLAENADPPLIVLDLSQTKFFGSAFIELMFRTWNQLNHREGGKFGLSGLSEYCREVVEVTHLDRLWSVHTTWEEAVKSMQQASE